MGPVREREQLVGQHMAMRAPWPLLTLALPCPLKMDLQMPLAELIQHMVVPNAMAIQQVCVGFGSWHCAPTKPCNNILYAMAVVSPCMCRTSISCWRACKMPPSTLLLRRTVRFAAISAAQPLQLTPQHCIMGTPTMHATLSLPTFLAPCRR